MNKNSIKMAEAILAREKAGEEKKATVKAPKHLKGEAARLFILGKDIYHRDAHVLLATR